MARTDSKWMPVYVADYLADTTHLSTLQHGAFLLLLFSYWRRGSKIPDSDVFLAQVARMPVKEWLAIRPMLADLFEVSGGWWTNRRLEIELAKAAAHTKAKAEAGAKGGHSRWQKHSTAMPPPLASESRTDTPSPLPSQLSSDNSGATAPVARKSRKPRRTRLENDWKPSERNWAYARKVGLTDGEISSLADEFRKYWTSDNAAGNGLKGDWNLTWENRVDDRAPRIISGRSGGAASRGASPTAARDSILAKAGIRRGEAGVVHPDPERGARGGIAGEASSGTVIDADGWREVPGSADGDEAADPPESGLDGGLGGATRCLPQAADGVPGGRGVLRADDATGNLAVVARMGGTEGAAGGFDAPEEADAGGSDLDLPAFLDRRHKLSA